MLFISRLECSSFAYYTAEFLEAMTEAYPNLEILKLTAYNFYSGDSALSALCFFTWRRHQSSPQFFGWISKAFFVRPPNYEISGNLPSMVSDYYQNETVYLEISFISPFCTPLLPYHFWKLFVKSLPFWSDWCRLMRWIRKLTQLQLSAWIWRFSG